MTIFKFFIPIFLLCLAGNAPAAGIKPLHLPQSSKKNQEFLLYRLSYSGVFTFFAWKDLADVVIIADNKPYKFNNQNTCRLHLKMSTEDFSIAELFSPMRYHWRTTLSPDQQYIFLSETINNNNDPVHDVKWLDIEGRQIEMYHRRKRLDDPFVDFFDDDYEESDASTEKWESDGIKQPPDFLVNEPEIEDGLSYLVHEKTVKLIDNRTVFDPLSLIYSARWKDYEQKDTYDYVISYKDSFENYRVRFIGKETVNVGTEAVDTLKLDIRRNHENSENNEGFMHMWLTDDDRRIPVKYTIDGKVGQMLLEINPDNYKNYKSPANCVVRFAK